MAPSCRTSRRPARPTRQGPLNSYQGVPAQPAGTTQGVVWVAGAEPGGNASRAMAVRSRACANARRTPVWERLFPVPKPRYAVSRPGRGSTTSSGSVAMSAASAAAGASIPSTAASRSAADRSAGEAVQRRTITGGGGGVGTVDADGAAGAADPVGDASGDAGGAGEVDGLAAPPAAGWSDPREPQVPVLGPRRDPEPAGTGDLAHRDRVVGHRVHGSPRPRSPRLGCASRDGNAPSGEQSVNRTVRGPTASTRPSRPS